MIGLFSPSVQNSREAARRSQCKNNLKQFGLALHNYHDVFNCFPPGYIYKQGKIDGEPANLNGNGWGLALTPFMDQAPLYNQYNFNRPLTDSRNQKVRETHIQHYICPLDNYSTKNFYEPSDQEIRFAMSSYVGNFGPPDMIESPEKGLGIFFRNSNIRLRDITDGTSNTVMTSERANWERPEEGTETPHPSTIWAGVVQNPEDPDDDGAYLTLFQSGHSLNSDESDHRDVSSPHEEMTHFLFCDGSVRAISNDLDLEIYSLLTNREDGKPVPEF
ncbi:DUF1559 domain-containing protein [Planctomicrobium sp. SH668]|uniref:DUF1559 domain-containing protein n=1 Tax=Planctomicrobium sp. SH668 TaxID=3448126 RepID=UPI003F5BB976